MSETPMNKAQLIAHFAEKFSLTKVQVTEIIGEFSALAISETLRAGEFTLPGIGKLVRQHRPAHIGHNPATREAIQVAEQYVAKMRLGKTLKDALK